MIQIEIDEMTAMCIIGNIQLATRHPQNNGPSRQIAEDFARQLQQRLEDSNYEYSGVIELG